MKVNPLQRLAHHLALLQFPLLPHIVIHLPRLKQQLQIVQPPQLLHPHLDIVTLGIVVERLLDRVEHPGFAGIVAYASVVLPVAPVAAEVVIDQQAFVPFGADAPVNAHVFGEEAGDVLPETIGGVAYFAGSESAVFMVE